MSTVSQTYLVRRAKGINDARQHDNVLLPRCLLTILHLTGHGGNEQKYYRISHHHSPDNKLNEVNDVVENILHVLRGVDSKRGFFFFCNCYLHDCVWLERTFSKCCCCTANRAVGKFLKKENEKISSRV